MTRTGYSQITSWKLDELLQAYEGLEVRPSRDSSVVIRGNLVFLANYREDEGVTEEYKLKITIPPDYPNEIPQVWEIGGRIPSGFHKLKNGALCLGSPMRLRLILLQSVSIKSFVERCVIPYLYAYTIYRDTGALPYGELQHGVDGLLEDTSDLIGISSTKAPSAFVALLAMKKRHANKRQCPCGSGRRLGRCHNKRLNFLRKKIGRGGFAYILSNLSRKGKIVAMNGA